MENSAKDFLQEILTVDEAATFLRVSSSSIYKLAQEGKIPCRKAGRQWRFSRSALIRWIEQPVGESSTCER